MSLWASLTLARDTFFCLFVFLFIVWGDGWVSKNEYNCTLLFSVHTCTASGPLWSSWRKTRGSIKRLRGSRPSKLRWGTCSRRWAGSTRWNLSAWVYLLDALILMLSVANAIVFFRTRSLLIQTTWRWTGSWMCPTVWTRTTARWEMRH